MLYFPETQGEMVLGGTWGAVAVWTLLDSDRANEKITGETTLGKRRWWRVSFEQMTRLSC